MPETQTIFLHPARLRAVIEILQMIFEQGKYADKAIAYALRNNPKAGAKDRGFIAEHSYEIVRYFRYYTTLLGFIPKSDVDWWRLLGIYFLDKGHALPDFKEFGGLEKLYQKAKLDKTLQKRTIRESIPDWMDQVCAEELKENWEPTLSALNKQAPVILRANRLQNSRDELATELKKAGHETITIGEGDALQLIERSNIFTTEAFKAGKFELQDQSSQEVALYLAPQPGMRVVDACAGGGGKTLHIASLMQNKGSVIALDTYEWKLQELKLRARRAGAHNIRTQVIENAKSVKRLANSADRLLLDVPCSGLGVLRRNPDAKWKLSEEFLDTVRKVQAEILRDYSIMCKPGGRMVYATCSILPSENRIQVDQFLQTEAGKQFRLLSDRSILPQETNGDGFYMALMERALTT